MSVTLSPTLSPSTLSPSPQFWTSSPTPPTPSPTLSPTVWLEPSLDSPGLVSICPSIFFGAAAIYVLAYVLSALAKCCCPTLSFCSPRRPSSSPAAAGLSEPLLSGSASAALFGGRLVVGARLSLAVEAGRREERGTVVGVFEQGGRQIARVKGDEDGEERNYDMAEQKAFGVKFLRVKRDGIDNQMIEVVDHDAEEEGEGAKLRTDSIAEMAKKDIQESTGKDEDIVLGLVFDYKVSKIKVFAWAAEWVLAAVISYYTVGDNHCSDSICESSLWVTLVVSLLLKVYPRIQSRAKEPVYRAPARPIVTDPKDVRVDTFRVITEWRYKYKRESDGMELETVAQVSNMPDPTKVVVYKGKPITEVELAEKFQQYQKILYDNGRLAYGEKLFEFTPTNWSVLRSNDLAGAQARARLVEQYTGLARRLAEVYFQEACVKAQKDHESKQWWFELYKAAHINAQTCTYLFLCGVSAAWMFYVFGRTATCEKKSACGTIAMPTLALHVTLYVYVYLGVMRKRIAFNKTKELMYAVNSKV